MPPTMPGNRMMTKSSDQYGKKLAKRKDWYWYLKDDIKIIIIQVYVQMQSLLHLEKLESKRVLY